MHIAPLPPAYADLALLQCVFENLLSNALKFSAKCEDPVVEVGVEESAEGETIFFVSDNGAGFDMGVTTHLFDPFIRLHDSAAYPGTGVGLAIVKNVIDRHHGRVWAQAAPGRGQSSALPWASNMASRRFKRRPRRQNRSAGNRVGAIKGYGEQTCRPDVT